MSAPALRCRLRPRLRLGGASNTDEANPGESPIACVLNRLCLCELSGKLSLSLWNVDGRRDPKGAGRCRVSGSRPHFHRDWHLATG